MSGAQGLVQGLESLQDQDLFGAQDRNEVEEDTQDQAGLEGKRKLEQASRQVKNLAAKVEAFDKKGIVGEYGELKIQLVSMEN